MRQCSNCLQPSPVDSVVCIHCGHRLRGVITAAPLPEPVAEVPGIEPQLNFKGMLIAFSVLGAFLLVAHRDIELITAIALRLLVTLLFVVQCIVPAKLFRIGIQEIVVGIGGSLGWFKLGKTTFRFRWFPMETGLKLQGSDESADNNAPRPARPPEARRDYNEMRPAEKVGFHAIAIVLGIVTALIFLGWPLVLRASGTVIHALIATIMAPRQAGGPLLNHYLDLVAAGRFRYVIGLNVLLNVLIGLIPTPFTLSGRLLIDLFTWINHQPPPRKLLAWLQLIALFGSLALGVIFIMALCAAVIA